MTVSSAQRRAVDYGPCRYNGSRLWFRGPLRSLRKPYIACVGGCEVYGRYVQEPLTMQLEKMTGVSVVNLGVEHVGVDAYLNDAGALTTAARAQVALVQITGCQNTSNRHYSVHPRRNDRFLRASEALIALYPEMDFTEVHFTGHLLDRLHDICPERFDQVKAEMRKAWRARMLHLIGQMSGQVVLYRFAERLPDNSDEPKARGTFPDRQSIEKLRPHVAAIVDCVPPDWHAGRESMDIPEMDAGRVHHLPGPEAHRNAAKQLAKTLEPLLRNA